MCSGTESSRRGRVPPFSLISWQRVFESVLPLYIEDAGSSPTVELKDRETFVLCPSAVFRLGSVWSSRGRFQAHGGGAGMAAVILPRALNIVVWLVHL